MVRDRMEYNIYILTPSFFDALCESIPARELRACVVVYLFTRPEKCFHRIKIKNNFFILILF